MVFYGFDCTHEESIVYHKKKLATEYFETCIDITFIFILYKSCRKKGEFNQRMLGFELRSKEVSEERKQTSSSIAWYKLSVLIMRREREKALNVYRLLAHSLEDKAYALQLEGDILWFLDDRDASEKYKQAAFLYKKEKRWVDAIAVCNHLLTIDPDNSELISTLLSLYVLTDWQDRFSSELKHVLEKLDKRTFSHEEVLRIVRSLVTFIRESSLIQKKTGFLHRLNLILLNMLLEPMMIWPCKLVKFWPCKKI